MRLVFMGSPEFAVPTLAELVASGHDIAMVYCQPPKPAGRGQAVTPCPVHQLALHLGLPVRTPNSLKSAEEQAAFADLGAEAAVVVAYGKILPLEILAAPPLGCFNLHGSLLPRWRGAAPLHRAIMAGDTVTGVQVMRMEAGLDTGPILMSERVVIRPDDTTGSVHDRMAPLGAGLMVRALAAIARGSITETPQDADGVTYATKIDKAEARIDWTRPAAEVDAHIRGLSPFPGAWFDDNGQRVKVLLSRVAAGAGAPGQVLDEALTVACGDGAVQLLRLQRAGRGVLDSAAFQRGQPIAAGRHL